MGPLPLLNRHRWAGAIQRGRLRINEDGFEYRGFPEHKLAAMQQKNSEYLARRRDYTAAALEKECVSCAAPVGEPCNPECLATAYSRAERIKVGEPPTPPNPLHRNIRYRSETWAAERIGPTGMVSEWDADAVATMDDNSYPGRPLRSHCPHDLDGDRFDSVSREHAQTVRRRRRDVVLSSRPGLGAAARRPLRRRFSEKIDRPAQKE